MHDETITILVKTDHSDKPEALEVPRRVGNVRLQDLLGEGGGGAVFSGYDEAIRRKVAVKFLHRRKGSLSDAAISELASGVRSAGRIKHPNIVTVFAVENVNRMPAIVMEFIDGISLRDLLRRTGPLELSLAHFVILETVAAVSALHNGNVIHRDLKPANVMFDREGHAHVCDFGLAIEFDTLRQQGGASNVGGSPLYMSPEMFDGHVSPQSDVYALGVMLFEVLSGAPPFSADTVSELRRHHTSTPPPLDLLEKRGVPAVLRDVVERCLHKQRVLRFKTATHLQRSLEEFERPEKRGEVLRSRLATIVSSQQSKSPTEPHEPPTPSPAVTTFDLIAERARKKRQTRDSFDAPS